MLADVLLTPGAGSSCDHPSLVGIDELLQGRVKRIDFLYRLAGRKFPDKQPVLLQTLVDGTSGMAAGPLILGGRSMGGRMCSIAAAQGLINVRALILICYPLHPPGKPGVMRTDHFPDLTMPCLFISGTKDAFGTPEELTNATTLIPGPVDHVWVEGADHSLRRKDSVVASTAAEWISGLQD
jgi:uncharacterized protein